FKTVSPKMEARVDSADYLHVLPKYSIESYFLDVETLSAAFTEIERSDLETLIGHYNAIYAKRLVEVKDKNGLEHFKKYARPKLLFDRSER
ncbi:hypothetical protein, partial [Francisella philomiragia]|uniref:hypothetical protein n=1 Tax=Francisella philomiragia TaxID=28110 RepID=UPI002244ACE5